MRISQDLIVYESIKEFKAAFDLNPKAVYSSKRKCYYIDITCAFDIETTNTDTDGFAYSFAFNVGGVNVVLRYIEDVYELFDDLSTRFNLSTKRMLIFHVHNLGYEHMYTTQLFSELYGRKSILFTAARKILTVKYGNGIEFRDSFRLFQKSLEKTTKGLPHEKLKGDLDYNIYRTPDTELTQKEFDYIVNDVQGLFEAIERLKSERNYNTASLPLTNTAMVIEAVNKYCNKSKSCLREMRKLTLNRHQMEIAYRAMAGGDTHGCRWRAGITFENCNSYDFKSAHPSQQLLRKFPSGRPIDLPAELQEEELQDLIDNDYGWIGLCYIEKMTILPECPDPTISFSKCIKTEGRADLDNGRVTYAESVLVYLDSNDYQRFRDAYEYDDFVLLDGFAFKLEYLPTAYTEAIKEYFRLKESASGAERNFAKICVNTIFGASAQKVIRDEWSLIDNSTLEPKYISWIENLKAKDEQEIWKKQQLKFPFLWGLWTSSCTRLELFKMLQIVGWENVIYWDTDSCKFEGEKKKAIDIYNADLRKLVKARDMIVQNDKGEDVYIGIAEDEHKIIDFGYRKFRFLHAKCYAAEAWNADAQRYDFEITIAGVQKIKGKSAVKNCENLKDGFYINDAGGFQLSYHDRAPFLRTDFKRTTSCASYIVMKPRDYLINIT